MLDDWMNSSVGIAFAPHVIIVGIGKKENLYLYGLLNETWEVNLPVEELSPEFPEPTLGINHTRDGMQKKDWLSLVAVHSDSWLLAVAFYLGSHFGFYCSLVYSF
ncbi:PHD finger protein Alfin1 [Ziziphus jujuba]|uniref:PHD finger protein ALFIN-LIKE n=1 Tax=Ziziphus jujuba TaxID=326968 RepID=A0A6P4A017_ZIZJJ|nr:PHD finger protein Alfin1 [Ziziphus jujuba]